LRSGGFAAHLNPLRVKDDEETRHDEGPAEQVVEDVRRATRKLHSSEEKIRIALSGFRGERPLSAEAVI
jgi:hypothetical protein